MPLRPRRFGLFALLSLISASCLGGYVYFQYYRPAYEHYTRLGLQETSQSLRIIADNQDHSTERYVRFKQLRGAGLNNQLQEVLLYHHLSQLSRRTYVHYPIVWRSRSAMSYVPLSAFVASIPTDSISEPMWNHVCPPEAVAKVSIEAEHEGLWKRALDVLQGPDQCIEIDNWWLTWSYLQSSHLQDTWPSFSTYLTAFQWSKQIDALVKKSLAALSLTKTPYVAAHLRRGDFKSHCHILADNGHNFTTWSNLPIVRSSISQPRLDILVSESIYEHCYPDFERIVSILNTSVSTEPHLQTKRLHILHDPSISTLPLLYYLRSALTPYPFASITSSSDLSIGRVEWDFAGPVDMEIARRAVLGFIGNGYSSLTGTIVGLRLADRMQKPEERITF